MHKRWPEFFVIDILIAIDKVNRTVSQLTFKDFVANEQYVDSVLRNLEIIGEATGQLLKYPDFLDGAGEIEWRKIVDFRNVIIHFYFGIDLDEIYGISLNQVVVLEKDILDFIRQKDDRSKFLQAIEDAKADLAEVFRHESVAYLQKIEKTIQ